jgi:tetratricopeptide (TPR) repeat protein
MRALPIQQITEAIRLAPKNSLYIYQKAYYLSISEEDDDEALKLLEKVLAINSKSAESWALKSDICCATGMRKKRLKPRTDRRR